MLRASYNQPDVTVTRASTGSPSEGAALSIAEGFVREADEVASVEPWTSVADLLEVEANVRLHKCEGAGARVLAAPTTTRVDRAFFAKDCMAE